jgi:hypothetical protein
MFSESPEREFKSRSLGPHTTEILQSIAGRSDEDVEALIRAKAVHTHAAS